MNEANNRQTAMENLRVIRQVLDRTDPSFHNLAPAFRRMGLVWLLCALVLLCMQECDVLSFLYPNASIFGLFGRVGPTVFTVVKVVLGAFLVVQCVLWRRNRGSLGLSEQAERLLALWQIMLVLYCLLYVLMNVGLWAVNNHFYAVPPNLDLGEPLGARWGDMIQVFGLLKDMLPILFPALPFLLTGSYLGDRRLLALGLVVLALYVGAVGAVLTTWVLGLNTAVPWVLGLVLVYPFLIYLLPPVTLLLVAWRLKGKK